MGGSRRRAEPRRRAFLAARRPAAPAHAAATTRGGVNNKGNDILDDPTRSSFPRKRESRGWIPASPGCSPSSPRPLPRHPGESRGLGERCPLDSGLRRNDEGSRTGAGGRTGVTKKNRLRDCFVYSSRNKAAIRDLSIDFFDRYVLNASLTWKLPRCARFLREVRPGNASVSPARLQMGSKRPGGCEGRVTSGFVSTLRQAQGPQAQRTEREGRTACDPTPPPDLIWRFA